VLEEAEGLDGSLKRNLKHKKSGGIVIHMLDIFDVIHEAHSRQGHLKVDKTLANCTMFYSPTYELCKLFIADCFPREASKCAGKERGEETHLVF
jgi:hypothetical protein